MRRKNQELRQCLLDCARRIECAEGADGLSIRKLAAEANIAIGTVYNYFESKQEVLLAMTEEYWNDALREMQGSITAERFSEQIRQIYAFLAEKLNDCAKCLCSLRRTRKAERADDILQGTVVRSLVRRLGTIHRFVRIFGANRFQRKRLPHSCSTICLSRCDSRARKSIFSLRSLSEFCIRRIDPAGTSRKATKTTDKY